MISINNLTDSEFLSFLYSERDRELSNKSYPGWSNWALLGTAIAIICYVYELCANYHETINYSLIIGYLNVLSALLLSYTPTIWFLVSLFKRKRMVDTSRVRTLFEIFPLVFFILNTLLSVGIFVFWLLVGMKTAIIWLWGSYLMIILLIWIYVIIERNRLVIAWGNFTIFSKDYLDICYIILTCSLLAPIQALGLREIRTFDVFCPEFKIVCCSLALLTVLYVFLQINIQKTDITFQIDLLIDEYLHSKKSKEEIYRRLEILRFGRNSAQALEYEIQEVRSGVKKLKDTVPALKKHYDELRNAKVTNVTELKSFPDEISSTLQQGRILIDKMEKLLSKGKNLLDLDIVIDAKQVATTIDEAKKELDASLIEVENLQKMTFQYIKQYACYSEGGLCGAKNCPNRHKRKSWIERTKRSFCKRES